MSENLGGGSLARQSFLRSAGPFVLCETWHGPEFTASYHVHERPSINIVLSGGYAETGRGSNEVWRTGSVVAKPAWSSHANYFRGTAAHCLLLEVQTSGLDVVSRASSLFAVPHACDVGSATSCVHSIRRELRRADRSAALALESLAYDLLARLSTVAERNESSRRVKWVSRVREMLEEIPLDQLSLSFLAKQVARHPAHVARAFKQRHGVTVGEYMRDRQLAAAAALLRSTELSISTIAHSTGFYDHSQFCHTFRKRTGQTPTEFRTGKAPAPPRTG
jgi:AraC-like DNA-binding protein